MNLVSWSPFDEMVERPWSLASALSPSRFRLLDSDVKWRPSADIIEKENEYLVKADLPEVKREDIELKIADGSLVLKGERRAEKDVSGEKEHRRETFYGAFERHFALPEDADQANISAECKDGVLKVHIPKTKVEKSKPIEIKVK